ncbi:MAG: AI-2E family transporter [Clostridiales bacterium]|nr:AI-2E family transporter [Clostridiales bacterium]
MDKSKRIDIIVIGVLLIVTYIILQHFGAIWKFFLLLLGILTPFLWGSALAFILNVPMRFFENKVFKKIKKLNRFPTLCRILALLITLALVVLVVYIVVSLLVPQISATLESIILGLPKAVERLNAFLTEKGFDLGDYLQTNLLGNSPEQLRTRIEQVLDVALKGVIYSTGVLGSVYSGLLQFCFTLMFTFYILFSKERLGKQFIKVGYAYLPEKKVDRYRKVANLTQHTFSSFISGQCLEALILGVLFFIAMSIFKMPYVLLISVFISVTALIPVVGAWLGCFVGVLLILMVNPMQALGFGIMFIVIQQLEGNLIYPHVMGNAIGLPSIWVLLAVVLGDGLLGVLGMLLFIPLTSVVYKLFREKVNTRINERGLESKLQ